MSQKGTTYRIKILALLLGSAIFILSCKKAPEKKTQEPDIIPTLISDSLTITSYKNGSTEYRFKTPHLVRYEGTDTAFMIFDKGISIVTFRDSTEEPHTWLTANYAIYREKDKIWEVSKKVVAHDREGKILYTELLYWDQNKQFIYSPLETKVISGSECTIGKNGFESDQEMRNIVFKEASGTFAIDTMSTDSLSPTAGSQPEP